MHACLASYPSASLILWYVFPDERHFLVQVLSGYFYSKCLMIHTMSRFVTYVYYFCSFGRVKCYNDFYVGRVILHHYYKHVHVMLDELAKNVRCIDIFVAECDMILTFWFKQMGILLHTDLFLLHGHAWIGANLFYHTSKVFTDAKRNATRMQVQSNFAKNQDLLH